MHAQARGRWWYRGDKKKNSYFAGVDSQAEKEASRMTTDYYNLTFSGVHLKGKAHVNCQIGGLRLEMNWY